MRKINLVWIFVIVLLGALLGSALGEVLGLVLPNGVVKEFFLRAVEWNLEPVLINLFVVTFTIGFGFKVNIIGGIGIILVGYFLKWAH